MSVGANRRADAANRRIFVALGVVLIIAGAVVWAASLGAFTDRSSDVILSASARSTVDDWSWLGWLAAAILAVAVLALSWTWLLFELRPHPTVDDLEVVLDDDLHVRVDSSAWLDAVLDDAQSLSDVVDARGRVDLDDDLRVTMLLSARDGIDPHALVQQIEGYVRKRAEHSLDRSVTFDIEIELAAAAPPARVA